MAKTYNELYLAMRRALKEAGVEEYALEARRLLAQGAGYTDAQLIARMYMYAGDEAERPRRSFCSGVFPASRWRISPENGSFSGWK